MTPTELLQRAAVDSSFDSYARSLLPPLHALLTASRSADWPATLQDILHRLDDIIHLFPGPPVPPTASAPDADLPPRPVNPVAASSQDSHTTDKENAPPTTPARPPVPAFSDPASPSGLPADVLAFYSSIRSALATNFARQPPHTVQRLAELILEPTKRYKFLPPYLRALDRVVSVSSPLSLFPLPQALLPTAGGLLNGTAACPSPKSTSLGSDEALGGALLTPIPWLQNRAQNELISESTEMVDGPNGAGRIETVSVGMLSNNSRPDTSSQPHVPQIASSHPDGETLPSTGPVTQGELLRQEQEAGIVLNNPHSLTNNPARATFGELENSATIVETVEGEEEAPHARGPELIGMEDTGPQKLGSSLNIEGAIGRPSVQRASKSPGPSSSDLAKDGSPQLDTPKGITGTEDQGTAASSPSGGTDVEM